MLVSFLLGAGIAAAAFAAVWAISVRVNNYSFLDVAWSYGIAVLAPLYSCLGPGDGLRKWTLTVIGAAWSLRLGTHILMRMLRQHPKEDPRYQSLRKDWPSPLHFLLFFELQALIAVLLSLPFLLVAFDARPGLTALEVAGFAVAVLALAGEMTADTQMTRFVSQPANKGKVCREGLWRYSRHPNYFFEALIWWGFFLAALPAPWGWTTIVCPLMILWFLLRVTGIPLTEKHSIESKARLRAARLSPLIPCGHTAATHYSSPKRYPFN